MTKQLDNSTILLVVISMLLLMMSAMIFFSLRERNVNARSCIQTHHVELDGYKFTCELEPSK